MFGGYLGFYRGLNYYCYIYVHVCTKVFYFFLIGRNRFGNAINGFRRGALVSEKSARWTT